MGVRPPAYYQLKAPPPPRRTPMGFSALLIGVVVILIVVGMISCSVIYYAYLAQYEQICEHKQEYSGETNVTAVTEVLENASWGPVSESPRPTGVQLEFSPFCGNPNSTRANESSDYVRDAFVDLYDNVTPGQLSVRVKLRGERHINSDERTHKKWLQCIGDAIEEKFESELNLTYLDRDWRCKNVTPGFEVPMVMATGVGVVLFKRYRKSKMDRP
jgi:hypothetical protein